MIWVLWGVGRTRHASSYERKKEELQGFSKCYLSTHCVKRRLQKGDRKAVEESITYRQYIKHSPGMVWWHTPGTQALSKWICEAQESQVILEFMAGWGYKRPSLKKQTVGPKAKKQS